MDRTIDQGRDGRSHQIKKKNAFDLARDQHADKIERDANRNDEDGPAESKKLVPCHRLDMHECHPGQQSRRRLPPAAAALPTKQKVIKCVACWLQR
jgi:hypothetical protein